MVHVCIFITCILSFQTFIGVFYSIFYNRVGTSGHEQIFVNLYVMILGLAPWQHCILATDHLNNSNATAIGLFQFV